MPEPSERAPTHLPGQSPFSAQEWGLSTQCAGLEDRPESAPARVRVSRTFVRFCTLTAVAAHPLVLPGVVGCGRFGARNASVQRDRLRTDRSSSSAPCCLLEARRPWSELASDFDRPVEGTPLAAIDAELEGAPYPPAVPGSAPIKTCHCNPRGNHRRGCCTQPRRFPSAERTVGLPCWAWLGVAILGQGACPPKLVATAVMLGGWSCWLQAERCESTGPWHPMPRADEMETRGKEREVGELHADSALGHASVSTWNTTARRGRAASRGTPRAPRTGAGRRPSTPGIRRGRPPARGV